MQINKKGAGIRAAMRDYREWTDWMIENGQLGTGPRIFYNIDTGEIWTRYESGYWKLKTDDQSTYEIYPGDVEYLYGKVNERTLRKYINDDLETEVALRDGAHYM